MQRSRDALCDSALYKYAIDLDIVATFEHSRPQVFLFHLLSATSKPFSSLSNRLAHAARLGFFLQKRAI